ncbi:Ig-like domain-containing protein [Pseudomonas nitroreducens]|uniref:Ig-like domain-containing protein n=1 Tax=Pseudomonas nitroreducens TaxID=46680 RepID=UPI00209E1D74|nr:Ig-like domain-containing protein [Pseudomonas nitroreducens]MCP1626221.1 antitoxin (DNA-binding transcriptional repressor) of toxin-antitoxin stability system [Pseudomonas nitroreducens]
MAIQAKVVASQVQVATATQQTVEGSIVLQQASNVALDVTADAVASYQQVGADLVVQLKDGETIRIANFFAEGQPPSQLYLVDEKGDLVVTELDQVAADGTLMPTYAAEPIDAGFESLTGAEAGAAAAGGVAGLGTAGTILAGAAVIAGGAAIASSGGGGGGGGGGGSNPPAPPAPATDVTVSPDGSMISGRATAGSTVEVDVNGDGQPDYTAPVDGNGNFQVPVSPPLSNGENVTVVVRGPNGGGASSGTTVTAPDTTAPGAATGVTVSDDGSKVSGSAEPGSTVKVDTNGDGIPDATGVAGSDGHFEITLPAPVNNGQGVSVTVTDPAGNTSPPTLVNGPDTTPPEPAHDLSISADRSGLSGIAEPGSSLSIDLNNDGVPDLIVQVGPDGRFSLNLDSPLPVGQIVSIIVRDAAGNASPVVSITAPGGGSVPAPVIDPSNGHILQGTGSLGTTVYLSNAQGTLIGVAVVGGDGHWSFTPLTPLADGTVVNAVARGPQGESSSVSVTVDGIAPGTPSITSGNAGGLEGTAEAGATVVLTTGNGTPLATVVADGNGHWSFPTGSPLPNGTQVTVVAKDAAGNLSGPAQITLDTQPPAVPTVNASNGGLFSGVAEAGSTVLLLDANGQVIAQAQADGSGNWQFTFNPPLGNGTSVSVTATDAAGNTGPAASVTVDSSIPSVPTVDPSNGLSISGSADAGDRVEIRDANGNLIAAITADGDGHWSFTPGVQFPDGTQLQVVAVDPQSGQQSQVVNLVVDGVAPDAPQVDVSNGIVLSGIAEPGSLVTLTDNLGNPIGQVRADGVSGAWSFTPGASLPDGAVVVVRAIDAAGNPSPPTSVVVDAVAPPPPQVNASNGLSFSGSAEQGATVIILDANGNPIGQVTADAGTGQWSFTPPSALPNGTQISVVARDAAGNVGQPTPLIVDRQAPDAPQIDASNGDVLHGSAEPGSTVTLTDGNGNPIAQVVADPVTGDWSFTPGTPLGNGTQVNATATDAAGNVSQVGQITVDNLPPNAPSAGPSNGTQISGTAEPGSTVVIMDASGQPLGEAAVGLNGFWLFRFSQALPTGFVLRLAVRDAAGNVGAETTTTVDSNLTTPPTPDASNGSVISGTAEAGQQVIVRDANGNEIGRTTADGDGNWSVTPASPLANGTDYQVVAVDPVSGHESVPIVGTVDSVAPAAPTINGSTGTTLTGTAEPGSTVTLSDGNGNPIAVVTADGNGQWTFTPGTALPNGTLVNVTATDAAGNVSQPANTTVDSVAPPAPQVDPSNGQLLTGTAEANATVIIRDAGGNVIGEAVADGGGVWSFAPQPALADGTQVTVMARDAAGNESGTVGVTVDAQPPAAPVVTPSTGAELSGTAEPNAQVVVISANGQVIAEVPVGPGGTWSYTPSTPLPDGATLSVVAVDSSGNRSGTTTVTIDSTPPADPVVNPGNGTQVSGTAEPGSTVTVTDSNNNPVGQTTADGQGNWSITPASPLPDGSSVTVVATDPAGNASNGTTVIIDTSAPTTPAAAPSNGTVLSGTGEDGSTLVFTDGAGNALGQVTVGAGGNWTFTPDQPLADGTVVTIVARDAAGNESGPVQVTVDSSAPGTPTLDPSNGLALGGTGEIGSTVIVSVAGSEVARVQVGPDGRWSYTPGSPIADGTAISVQGTDAAGNTTPIVSGSVDGVAPGAPDINPSNGTTFTGTAEAGSTVILSGPNGEIGRALADGEGHWTFTATTPVGNGVTVSAVAQDAAGNTSGSDSVVVDSSAPAAPSIDPSNGTLITGTSEIASTITLVYANNVLIGQATTDPDGNWTFTPNPPLADGTKIDVIAQDAAGNASSVASIIIDATPPAAPVVAASNGSVLTGTAEPGSSVTISRGGVELGSATADPVTGQWSITPTSAVGNGDVLQVAARDAAGNISQPTAVTIDAVPPGQPVINATNGALLSGTAEAGSTVLLSDGSGNPLGTAVADANGHWSLTPTSPLPDGTTVNALAQDAAGNQGPSQSVVVDNTLPDAPIINASNGSVISGTAVPGAEVVLSDGSGNEITRVIADPISGQWSYVPGLPLANGTEVVAVAVVEGRTSGVSAITIDAVAPDAPTIVPSNGTELSGTAEAGSTVILADGNGDPVGQTVADGSGHWSFSPVAPLANGTVVNVVAQDAAGNVSARASTTVDSVAPIAPTLNASNGNVVTGSAEPGATVLLTDGNGSPLGQVVADATTGQWSFTPNPPLVGGTTVNAVAQDAAGNTSTLANTVVDTTAPTTPTILPSNGSVLSGTGEAGSSIVLTDGNGNPIAQVSVDGNGKWTYTPASALPNGTTVNAVSVDAAGNQSSSVNTVVDTTAPADPTINLSNGTLLTGTAEANALVLLSDGSGNPIGQVRADANGAWSLAVSPALANGTVVSAQAKDAAGNTSNSVSTTVDSVAPVAPTIAVSNGAELHGTAENNATVLLTDGNGNLIGQTTTNGSGNWTFTPGTALANGTVVNAVARDATGNTSVAATTTVDSVAPPTPTINASNGTLLTGTAEADATVILTDGNGNPIAQVTANGSGEWSFAPGVALPDGTVVNVVAQDAAGNTSGSASTTVDAVAPASPTIDPSNGVHITGTATAGVTVVLTDGGGNPIGTTVADGAGNWSFDPSTPLGNGVVIQAASRDAVGNTSGSVSTTVDNVAPPPPTIEPSNGTELAGTAEANATVVLTDGNGNLIGTTVANGSGDWEFTPSPTLANGTTVTAVAQDAAGNTSGSASTVVDSQPPQPPVIDPSNGTLLSGTAELGVTVVLSVDGVELARVAVQGDGTWSFPVPSALANGTVVDAVTVDATGNLSASVSVTIDALAPLAPTVTPSDGAVLAGTAEANATVFLRDGLGNLIGSVQADANGNWHFVPDSPLGDGLEVVISARDAVGNVSLTTSVVIDASLPAVPVIAPSNGTVISGTAEANATIILTTTGGLPIGQVNADVNGNWSFTPGTPLADGTVINAVARDASNNLSGVATLVVDAVAPNVPVVSPSNGSQILGTAEAGSTVVLSVGGVSIAQVVADGTGHWTYSPGVPLANGVQVSVVAKDATGNTSIAAVVTVDSVAPNTPTIAASNGITFTGTAEANSTVIISGANGALLGQVTANASGIWTFNPSTPVGNGVVVSAVAKDAAGNVSLIAATTTVDAQPPALPVVNPSNGALLAGTAEAGATVVLSVAGNIIGQVTANAQGQWSFAPGVALANGVQVSVVAKDAVGNTSIAASVTVDAVAPTAPVVAPSNGSVLSGTAEIGSTVILKVGGAIIAQVTADATGNWSFTPGSPLANNTQVSVTAKDAAGNTSVATTIGVDSVAPVAPSGLSVTANGTVLSGIAEANSTVKVIINGDAANPITVQANGSGNFTVNLSPALTAGQLLTVNAVDAAGNAGAAIQIQAPDLTRPLLTIAEAADGYINKAELADGIQVRVGLTAGARAGQTLTLRYNGPGGYTFSQAHVLTAAEITAGVVLVTMLPAAGVAAIPQGAATVTADVNGGLTATPASFTLDTIAPTAPVLSLAGNLLGISGEANSTLTVDVNVAGLSSHTELSAGSTGLGSLDLLTGLSGMALTWDQLLDASISVASRDAAGNVSGAALGLNLENVLAQNTVTIGGLGLAVGLLPPVLGVSGTAIAGGSLAVQVITPLVNVTLHPIVDSTGHFTINLLAPDLLAQLGLSVTGLLNLGSQLSLQLVAYDAAGHQSSTYGLSLTGSGLSLAIGEVSVTGTAGADVFVGQSGAEHFYGNAGADLFLHVGTNDIVQAGDGNDTIQLQATNFKSIDGGTGFDTIMLDHGISLNYGALGTGTWTNIERVDMGKGDTGGSLTLTAAQVDAVTDANNVLQVTGDSNDTLTVRGAVDTGVNQVHSGISYDVYTFGNTTLLVEENTVHVVVS